VAHTESKTASVLVVSRDAGLGRGKFTNPLAKLGCQLSLVASVPEALQAARQERPAVIILDAYDLGEWSDSLDRLRRDSATQSVPVLLLGEEESPPGGGDLHWLQRPFSPQQLARAVSACLSASPPGEEPPPLGGNGDVERLTRTIERLESRLKELEERGPGTELRDLYAAISNRFEEMESQVLRGFEGRLRGLREDLSATLEERLGELRRELAEAGPAAPLPAAPRPEPRESSVESLLAEYREELARAQEQELARALQRMRRQLAAEEEQLAGRVGELTQRLDKLEEASGLDQHLRELHLAVASRLEDLEQRLQAQVEQALRAAGAPGEVGGGDPQVAALQAQIKRLRDELEAEKENAQELEDRLVDVERRLAKKGATAGDTAVSPGLETLLRRLDELESRPLPPDLTVRLEALESRLAPAAELEPALAELSRRLAELEKLRSHIEPLSKLLEDADPASFPGLETLYRRLQDLESRPLPPELVSRLEALESRLAPAAELEPALAELSRRLAELEKARSESQGTRQAEGVDLAAFEELRATVNGLQESLSGLVARHTDEQRRRLEHLAGEVRALQKAIKKPAFAAELEGLAASLKTLQEQMSGEGGEATRLLGSLQARLDELAGQVEALAGQRERADELGRRLDELAGQVEALAGQRERADELGRRLDELARELEAHRQEVARRLEEASPAQEALARQAAELAREVQQVHARLGEELALGQELSQRLEAHEKATDERLAALRGELAAGAELAELRTHVEALEKRLADEFETRLEAERQRVAGRLDILEESLGQQTTDIAAALAAAERRAAEVEAEQRGALEALRSALEELPTHTEARLQALHELIADQIKAHSDWSYGALQTLQRQVTAALEKLRSSLPIDSLTERIKTLEGRLQEMAIRPTAALQQLVVEEIRREMAGYAERVAVVLREVQARLEAQVAESRQSFNADKKVIVEHISELEDRLSYLTSSLESRFSNLSSRIRAQLAAEPGRPGPVGADPAALEAMINKAVEARLAEIREKVRALPDVLRQYVEGKVLEHTVRQAAEARSNLTAQLDKLRQQMEAERSVQNERSTSEARRLEAKIELLESSFREQMEARLGEARQEMLQLVRALRARVAGREDSGEGPFLDDILLKPPE
jgi:DNA repair exonuclease SbcCD ATPase subunit